MAPQVLLLLLGGAVSDRFERRLVLMLSDAIRGAAIAAIGVLSVTGTLELWHVVVLVAVYGAGGAVFAPSFTGIVRDVVPRDLLLEANSLDQFVRPLCVRLDRAGGRRRPDRPRRRGSGVSRRRGVVRVLGDGVPADAHALATRTQCGAALDPPRDRRRHRVRALADVAVGDARGV